LKRFVQKEDRRRDESTVAELDDERVGIDEVDEVPEEIGETVTVGADGEVTSGGTPVRVLDACETDEADGGRGNTAVVVAAAVVVVRVEAGTVALAVVLLVLGGEVRTGALGGAYAGGGAEGSATLWLLVEVAAAGVVAAAKEKEEEDDDDDDTAEVGVGVGVGVTVVAVGGVTFEGAAGGAEAVGAAAAAEAFSFESESVVANSVDELSPSSLSTSPWASRSRCAYSRSCCRSAWFGKRTFSLSFSLVMGDVSC